MALNFSSPSVQIQEIDKTQTIRTNTSRTAIITLAAEIGPVNTITFVSNETELVSIFGKPNANNYTEWFSILSLLSYNVTVGVIRPADSTVSLVNANATLTGFDNTLQISGTGDYYEQLNNYKFAARTPTDKLNNYTVKAIDHGADQILTIAGAVLNDDEISVSNATGIVVNDYIKIGLEYLQVTAVASNILTVLRGQLGTTATAYDSGSIVTKVNYADSIVSGDSVDIDVAAGNITSNATTITLDTAIPVTYTPGSYLKIERIPVGGVTTTEIVKIFSVNNGNNTLLVQRGQLGTTATAFSVTTIGIETSLTLTTTLVNLSLTNVSTTLSNEFPSYTIPTFTGATGDIVVSGNTTGWVYSVTANAITVVLRDSTKKFKTGDTLYNDDGVTSIGVIGNIEDYYSKQYITPGVPWSTVAPQPGTSIYGAQNGAKFDELHLVVLDANNAIVERYTYLSKAADALTTEGSIIYWKSVLTNRSVYVYGGNQDFTNSKTLTLEVPVSSAYTNGQLNATLRNTLYSVFKNSNTSSTISTTLTGGASYDFSSPAIINAVLESGYDLVADSESFADIDALVPGRITTSKVNKLINIVNTRRDCRVFISPLYSDVVNSNTSSVKTQDIINFFDTISSTSYAVFDSGYKYVYDKYNDTYYWIPCAADVAGLTLSTQFPWVSPAGVTKGIIQNALKIAYSPKKNERDLLYSARVNPIANFPGTGIVLYGDRTALSSPSAFGQIGVRGLFITAQKIIGQYADNTLFEINDDITRGNFSFRVSSYLQTIVDNRGIKEYKVVCDETNNTPVTIDENKFFCDIYIKPLRSINFIVLTFVAQPSGITFNETIA